MRATTCLCLSLFAFACDGDTTTETDAAPTADAGLELDAAPCVEPDLVDHACDDAEWVPGACVDGTAVHHDNAGQQHIPDEVSVCYDVHPPSSGNHRGAWAKWGEYDFCPPQRWLHNLEHGGAAFLYHPCAPEALVAELRAYAQGRGDDFRYILSPYPGLDSAVAVVAWEWTYTAECVDGALIDDFIDRHYGQAPEDVPHPGSYDTGWIGR